MSPRNVFLILAGILSIIVCLVILFTGKSEENPFLFLSWEKKESIGQTSEEIKKIAPSKTAGQIRVKNYYVSVVTYTGNGFEPRVLVIDRGENVRFVNQSSLAMRMQITLTGDAPRITTYTQGNNSGKGEYYELSFSEPGVWSYVNMNGDQKKNGIVYVR